MKSVRDTPGVDVRAFVDFAPTAAGKEAAATAVRASGTALLEGSAAPVLVTFSRKAGAYLKADRRSKEAKERRREKRDDKLGITKPGKRDATVSGGWEDTVAGYSCRGNGQAWSVLKLGS